MCGGGGGGGGGGGPAGGGGGGGARGGGGGPANAVCTRCKVQGVAVDTALQLTEADIITGPPQRKPTQCHGMHP